MNNTGITAKTEGCTVGWHDGRAQGMLFQFNRIPREPASAGLTTFSYPVKESMK
jgi:hypothetical protein